MPALVRDKLLLSPDDEVMRFSSRPLPPYTQVVINLRSQSLNDHVKSQMACLTVSAGGARSLTLKPCESNATSALYQQQQFYTVQGLTSGAHALSTLGQLRYCTYYISSYHDA